MNELTKIDIACGWEKILGRDTLTAKDPLFDAIPWCLWDINYGASKWLASEQKFYSAVEQEDSVLGLIGVVISQEDGGIISIDDWKLYDADFDAPQELLDQLQVWQESTASEITATMKLDNSLNESAEAFVKAIEGLVNIKPKTRKEKIKDAVLMVLVNIGASVLFVMSSMLMFLFAVVNAHKTYVHINEYGVGSAEYLMAATALMLFALAWFGTERLFNRLVK